MLTAGTLGHGLVVLLWGAEVSGAATPPVLNWQPALPLAFFMSSAALYKKILRLEWFC